MRDRRIRLSNIADARALVSRAERDALVRAEAFCDQAEFLAREASAEHAQARVEVDQLKEQARADVARLLQEAIDLIDRSVVRVERDRRRAASILADAYRDAESMSARWYHPAGRGVADGEMPLDAEQPRLAFG